MWSAHAVNTKNAVKNIVRILKCHVMVSICSDTSPEIFQLSNANLTTNLVTKTTPTPEITISTSSLTKIAILFQSS